MYRVMIVSERSQMILSMRSCVRNYNDFYKLDGVYDDVLTAMKVYKETDPHIVVLDTMIKGSSGLDFIKCIQTKGTTFIHMGKLDSEKELLSNGVEIYCLNEEYSSRIFNYVLKSLFLKLRRLNSLGIDTGDKEENIMTVWGSERLRQVKLTDIVKIRSDGSYSEFFLKGNKKIVSCKNLGVYEIMLKTKGFVRIHKSCLVNLNHIVSYTPGVRAYVTLIETGDELVSKNKKRNLLDKFSVFY